MHCVYFERSKFLIRLIGIQGYCTFLKADIKKCTKVGYPPYICCKSSNGIVFDSCAVQLRMTTKDK